MKKTWIVSVAVGLVLGTAIAAQAGSGSVLQVRLTSSTYRTADGSLRGARESSDGTQYISCGVERISSSSSYLDVSCWARNASGTTYICRSSRATFADLALGINPASHVHFEYRPGETECTNLRVTQTSSSLADHTSSSPMVGF
jgi:hypothetical protein